MQGDAHRESLRHGYDDERDGYHEGAYGVFNGFRHLVRVGQDAFDVGNLEEEVSEACQYDDCAYHHAYDGDRLAKMCKLEVERCLDVASLLHLDGAFTFLGAGAARRGHHEGVALDDGGAAKEEVGRIGGVLVLGRLAVLVGIHLAGEHRFVHLQLYGFEHGAVGRNLVAAFEAHDIAHDDVGLRYLHHLGLARAVGTAAQTYHLDGARVLDLVEDVELAGGLHFEEEAHARGKHEGDEHAERLEQHFGFAPETIVFVERRSYGKNKDNKENDD